VKSSIESQLLVTRNKIAAACQRAGRLTSEVRLVAVSKTFPISSVFEAYQYGQLEFGENYIPEGSQKASELKNKHPEVKFHFIGHLQRNKVTQVVSNFDLIHTVDRIELAQEIDKQSAKLGKVMEVLLQVNISKEDTKSGCEIDQLQSLAETVSGLKNIKLKGIMSIGSAFNLDMRNQESAVIVTKEFEEMFKLKQELESSLGLSLPELSMGMSSDYELAISHGSTIVRIGSSIFGQRS
jgi:pyridoxal phosphate enzyme (YggS family)